MDSIMTPNELSQRIYKAYNLNVFVKDLASECWECYNIKPNQNGYIGLRLKGSNVKLHRLVCNITSIVMNGIDTPDKSHAMHSCDNRGCINPGHLKFGTREDNMLDMTSKGRNIYRTDLSISQIQEIKAIPSCICKPRRGFRYKCKCGKSNAAIAKAFNMSGQAIAAIRNGTTFANLAEEGLL